MVSVGDNSSRLAEYSQLSMWERQVLKIWIQEHVNEAITWEYTSLGLVELFEEYVLGFTITHGQLQQAMLQAGYVVRAQEGDIWVFDMPNSC
jgi:hypothetical protein